jgi:phage terminase small subunit
MPALKDPQLEKFAQFLLRNIVAGMARGKAAAEAAREAGYKGSSLVDNARKRAQRKDVKARIIELASPQQEQIEKEIAVDAAKAKSRLGEIIMAAINFDETAMPKDVINAVRTLAAMDGWLAPEKIEHSLNGHGDRLDRALAQARAIR